MTSTKARTRRDRTIAFAMAALYAVVFATDAGAAILSAKRGFADVGANYGNLQATGAGWYYTWGTGVANPGNFDAKHYPMFWSAPSQSTINDVKSRNPEYVLGFNEPERPDQANMTVAQAISSWTTISNSFTGTNTKLVSPAVSDTGEGQAWMANFMQQANANGLKVDAVAFHWYGVSNPNNPSGAASSFLSRVDSYHNQYNRPVFITEFAIHDWGGAYSDAEIIEANRQFLDIVIPALESRSYVAGYAWYHWFSDAHLYEGSTPTPMAHTYVGAVGSGQVANAAGQNLGEHVAYLTGGELTMTGASAGTVRYINALKGVSTISGTLDWGLNAGSNWVRVQPGATLRKAGSNQIIWNGISVTNHGTIDVAEGTLRLNNSVNISGSGKVRVSSGGTLSMHGNRDATSVTVNYPVELRGGTLSTDLANGFFAAGGATVAGAGTIAGKLTALTGSVVRVGGAGLSAPARFVIDNFESYSLGNVRDVASPPWTAHQNTSLADIEDNAGNNVLTFGWASDFRGTSRGLPENAAIDNDGVATVFFRFNSKTDDPDHSFGLGDQADTSSVNFGNYEAQLRITDNPSAAGTFMIDARNGGSFTDPLTTGLSLNTWYNVWLVVDQTTDSYDVYMNTGTASATAANKLNSNPLAFRNGTSDPLQTILGLAGSAPIDNAVRFDDLVYLTGADLTNPVGGFDPGLITMPATLTVQGDVVLGAGASLELDIFDTTTFDSLSIAGNLLAGGNLRVSLDAAAAPLQAGNVFDVFDFSSASGAFATLDLPSLAPGLSWNTANLLMNGALEVVAGLPGDYNKDGVVDSADYVAWRKIDGSPEGFTTWRSYFGTTSATGSGSANDSVPEPSASLLFCSIFSCYVGYRYRKRSQSSLSQ